MDDNLKKSSEAQEPVDRYTATVERVAEYLTQRILRGRDISGLMFDCAAQFPGIKLSVFADALRLVHARGGGDSLRRPQ